MPTSGSYYYPSVSTITRSANHNLLAGLQGGSGDEFFHIDSQQAQNLVSASSHAPATVFAAPLTISGQQVKFNYDSSYFQLSSSNLRHKDPYVINVKDYGATGNGTTDDTNALIAAQATSSLYNLPLVFPAGRYRYNQTLDFIRGPVILGSGHIGYGGSFLLYEGTGSAIRIQDDTWIPSGSWVYSSLIKDIGILSVGSSGNIGIECNGVSEMGMYGIFIGGDGTKFNKGLSLNTATLLNIDHALITHNDYGMELDSCSDINFRDGEFFDHASASILIKSGVAINIQGVFFEWNDYGVVFESNDNSIASISSVWVKNCSLLFNKLTRPNQIPFKFVGKNDFALQAKDIHIEQNRIVLAGNLTDTDYAIYCDLTGADRVEANITHNFFNGMNSASLYSNHNNVYFEFGENYSLNQEGNPIPYCLGSGTFVRTPLSSYTINTGSIVFNKQVAVAIPSTLIPGGTTQTINWNNGNSQILDLGSASGNVTLTLTNPVVGGSYLVKVIQHPSSAKNVVWPGECKWASGITPVITTSSGSIDMISLFYDGNIYACSSVQDIR